MDLKLNDLRAMHHRGVLSDQSLIKHAWMGTRTLASILKGTSSRRLTSSLSGAAADGNSSLPEEAPPRAPSPATGRSGGAGPQPNAGIKTSQSSDPSRLAQNGLENVNKPKPGQRKENKSMAKTGVNPSAVGSKGTGLPPSRLNDSNREKCVVKKKTVILSSSSSGSSSSGEEDEALHAPPVRVPSINFSGKGGRGATSQELFGGKSRSESLAPALAAGRKLSSASLKDQPRGAAKPDLTHAGALGNGKTTQDRGPFYDGVRHKGDKAPQDPPGAKRKPLGPSDNVITISTSSDDEKDHGVRVDDGSDEDQVFASLLKAQDHKRQRKDLELPQGRVLGTSIGGARNVSGNLSVGGSRGPLSSQTVPNRGNDRPKDAGPSAMGALPRTGGGTQQGSKGMPPPVSKPSLSPKGGVPAIAASKTAPPPHAKGSGSTGSAAVQKLIPGGVNASVARPQCNGKAPLPATSSVSGSMKTTNSGYKNPQQMGTTAAGKPSGSQTARPPGSMPRPPLSSRPGSGPVRSVVSASKYKPPQQKASSSLLGKLAFESSASSVFSSGFTSAKPAPSRPSTLYEAVNQV